MFGILKISETGVERLRFGTLKNMSGVFEKLKTRLEILKISKEFGTVKTKNLGN